MPIQARAASYQGETEIMLTRITVLLAVTLAVTGAAAKEPKPLFADDATIKLTLTGPFNEIARKAPRSTEPHSATLSLEGASPEIHAIELSARGNSRRRPELCDFPPLRIAFREKPGGASFFDGQKRLKLVTHCKRSPRYQQYYLLEYAVYKLMNIATPVSLEARLAEIDYVEADSGKTIITRYGFLIEDTDDAAKRNGFVEVDTPDIDPDQLNQEHAGRYALFQYMIGNLDWSMHSGPDGDDCCHNTKLVGQSDELLENLIPIAYDFDYSGFVNTPYAVPPENVNVSSVRTRRYRGFCSHNEKTLAAAAEFRAKQAEFMGALDKVSGLEKNTKRRVTRYLEKFFEDIESDESVEKKLLNRCRTYNP